MWTYSIYSLDNVQWSYHRSHLLSQNQDSFVTSKFDILVKLYIIYYYVACSTSLLYPPFDALIIGTIGVEQLQLRRLILRMLQSL